MLLFQLASCMTGNNAVLLKANESRPQSPANRCHISAIVERSRHVSRGWRTYEASRIDWHWSCLTVAEWVRALAIVALLTLVPAVSHGVAAQSTQVAEWIVHGWVAPGSRGVETDHFIPYDLDFGADGDIYVTGRVSVEEEGSVHLGAMQYNPEGGSIFIARIGVEGSVRWIRRSIPEEWGAEWAHETPGYWRRVRDQFRGLNVVQRGNSLYTNEGANDAVALPVAGFDGGMAVGVYTTSGEHRQSIPVGGVKWGSGRATGEAISIGSDSNSNLYVAGNFGGFVDSLFTGVHLLEAYDSVDPHSPWRATTMFLAKHAPDGSVEWTRRFGGPRGGKLSNSNYYNDHARGAFTVDSYGNTYLAGSFGPNSILGEGQPNEFVMANHDVAFFSLDDAGILRWALTKTELGFGSTALNPVGLAVDTEENLVVTWRDWTAGFGRHGEYVVTRISTEGNLLWTRQIEHAGIFHRFLDLATDKRGHAYVVGVFSRSVTIEGITITSLQDLQPDGYIAHYDADGKLLRVLHASGFGSQYFRTVAASPSGDIFIAGLFEGMVRLGSDTLVTRGRAASDIFIAKYGAISTRLWQPPEVPVTISLTPNYPNPFREITTITYSLPSRAHVRLRVFDTLGRQVSTLVDQQMAPGTHTATFSPAAVPSGTYFYQLEALSHVRTGRMIRAR